MLYISEERDIARNLALEEALLENGPAQPLLLLYRSAPAVVVGAHQNTHKEANAEEMAQRGLRLARRVSGGGTVYHDEGNVCFSTIMPCREPSVLQLGQYLAPVVQGLRRLGLDAETGPRNDILLTGEKITGTAARMRKNRLLFHGTLLYDAALDTLHGVLGPRECLVRAAGAPSVKSPVTNIRSHRDFGPTEDFVQALAQVLHPSPQRLVLDEALKAETERLAAEKYETWDWLYGRNPACTLRFWVAPQSAGPARPLQLDCKGDVVRAVDDATLLPVLQGTPLRGDALQAALARAGLALAGPANSLLTKPRRGAKMQAISERR